LAEFDEQILAIRRFAGKRKEEGQPLSETQCAISPENLFHGLPVRFGPDHPPSVILRENTFLELGNPLKGSASMVLWTRQAELIQDGLITRIGPDVPDAEGQSLPFGQVILLGGSRLEEKDLPRLERASNLSSLLEGYMIRHVPRKLWSRVSREAAEKGFRFETLGRAIMGHYKREFPLLERVEILFVTSSKADVEELEEIADEAKGKSLSIRKLTRTEEGIYECDELSCDDCPEKPTCDTIRDILVIRKKGKIVGIEIVRDQEDVSDKNPESSTT
jgi:CO dehydrogenase/acetyl-CoA synthase beta subunit